MGFKNVAKETVKGKILNNSYFRRLGVGVFDLSTVSVGDTVAIVYKQTVYGFEFYANGGDPTSVSQPYLPLEMPAGSPSAEDISILLHDVFTANFPWLVKAVEYKAVDNLAMFALAVKAGSGEIATDATGDITTTGYATGADEPVLCGYNPTLTTKSVGPWLAYNLQFFAYEFFSQVDVATALIFDNNGVLQTWDGRVNLYTERTNDFALVTVDNSGASDFSGGDKILVTLYRDSESHV